jgi:hypothetical protein
MVMGQWFCPLALSICSVVLSLLESIQLAPDVQNDGFTIDRSLKLDFTVPEKHPYHFHSGQTSLLTRTNWTDSNTLIEAIHLQQPTVFSSAISHWPALKWDLWNLSSSWPILLDVLVLDRSLFVFHEVCLNHDH